MANTLKIIINKPSGLYVQVSETLTVVEQFFRCQYLSSPFLRQHPKPHRNRASAMYRETVFRHPQDRTTYDMTTNLDLHNPNKRKFHVRKEVTEICTS